MNNSNEAHPAYIEWVKHQYGSLIHLLWYIVTETSDRGADIAARALALLAPIPNAVSVYNVSQHSLGFTEHQALAFALTIELVLFAIIEVTLHMWNGWLSKPVSYGIPLAASIVATISVLAIVITVVYQLEVKSGGHWVLALLPMISLFAFVALGLKRWHERGDQKHSAVAQKRTARTVQPKPVQVVQPVQEDAQPAVDKAQRARQLKSEGLSNVQIGDVLGVHRNTVGAWLNGHSKVVQP